MAHNEFETAVKRGARSHAKKIKKKKVSLFVCFLALVIGLAIGWFGGEYICQNDTFSIEGNREYAISLNEVGFQYKDEGVKVIEFGRDISERVMVETNMIKLGNGMYTADITVPGKYYIKYTVASPKYGEVCRIRTFTIGGGN